MILYYGAGGGLGHLTRARAVIHTLGLNDRVALLTASPFATDRRVVGDWEVIRIPQNFSADRPGYQRWLQELLARYQPAELFVDAFPAGLLGEFSGLKFPSKIRLFHVARLLRRAVYQKLVNGMLPQFEITYVVEPLDEEHHKALATHSRQVMPLALCDPPHELSEAVKQTAIRLMRPSVSQLLPRPPQASDRTASINRPLWLIVHSGSREEIEELLAYAVEMSRQEGLEPRLVLLAPVSKEEHQALSPPESLSSSKPLSGESEMPEAPARPRLAHFDFYPASAIFPVADRIITACGFNAMRQTEAYREKHRFLPFARQFDNQFARACRRKQIVPLD